MRNRADAELAAQRGKTLRLVRPDLKTVYDLELALRAGLRWERANFQGAPPSPDEIAGEDRDWIDSIFLALDWIQFFRDYEKRPGWMK